MLQSVPAERCSFLFTHKSTCVTRVSQILPNGGTGRTLWLNQTFWRSGEGNTKRCLFRVLQLPKRARARVSQRFDLSELFCALFLCRASLGSYQVNPQQLPLNMCLYARYPFFSAFFPFSALSWCVKQVHAGMNQNAHEFAGRSSCFYSLEY
jgi:hypothetical protein